MSKVTRGWNDERRAQQAENIRKTKPWLKTKGPTSDAGKDTSAQNALKHGLRSAGYQKLLALLKKQKKYVESLSNRGSSRKKSPESLAFGPEEE